MEGDVTQRRVFVFKGGRYLSLWFANGSDPVVLGMMWKTTEEKPTGRERA